MKKVGVVRFPGTNCDYDTWKAILQMKAEPYWLWHSEHFSYKDFAALIVPGGFSYGDYLRAGALAARSPAMKDVSEAAKFGTPIMGICNGFQILCESTLLPGALVKNSGLRFIDEWVELKLANTCEAWGKTFKPGHKIKLPIAHGEGRFYAEEDLLKRLQDKNQIWWTYSQNPNGSLLDIAGVKNEKGNVCALMPHPERALTDWMGGVDGLPFFDWLT